MEDTRAELRAKRAARPSPWTWTFCYLGCILILCTLGLVWFFIAVLIMHLLLFR
ncbi:hypothetical protein OAE61_02205 [Verrucomicrobiales bacterium]|nr:hypothetical protein [Verrucomicrobiales bacterium]